MMNMLRNLRVRHRLLLWYSVLFVLILTVAGGVVYNRAQGWLETHVDTELRTSADGLTAMVETAVRVSVRNRLRAIAEKNIDILKRLEHEVRAGVLSETSAKMAAENLLLSQSVGKSGYIYTISGDGVVGIHPNRDLRGRDLSGVAPIPEQLRRRSGYLEYEWANPGEEKTRPKALYMEYFAPWDWIVSVSAYRNEFSGLVDIDDFRSELGAFGVGKSGYVFVLSGKGESIHHPWLEGDVSDLKTADGISLVSRMLADQSGEMKYLWKEPDSDTPHMKWVYYRYIPEMDWIVGSTSRFDEIYAPLEQLQFLFFTTAILALLLLLPLSSYLGANITRPLSLLMNKMREAQQGELNVRADVNACGEVGELATHFNQYMDRIEEFRDGLRAEIADRVQAELRLQLYEKVFENALEGISITDGEGNILAVNPAFSVITGYSREEVLGQNTRLLKSDRHEAVFYAEMWGSLKERGVWHGEIWNRRKNGEPYPEILSISAIRDEEGALVNYVAVFHDISDLKLKDQELEYQYSHDALTELPNRTLAMDRLGVAISHAKREGGRVAVFSLDIDDFKRVNDSLGHAYGDLLLQAVAKRLAGVFRADDTVARVGGDEFLVTVEHCDDERAIVDMAEEVLRSFEQPFFIKEHELHVTPSIGVALYPEDGDAPGVLVQNADLAMHLSKQRSRNSYNLFTQKMNERISRRIRLEQDMRDALRDRHFTVYFQPKVDLATETVCGMEALVRWEKPDGSIVSPADFIPLAEETGLIVPLGEFVLEASCRAMQVLDGMGCAGLKVSVNLSPEQFSQSDLVEMVEANLEKNGLPPARLELEITESTLMTDVESSIAKLDELVDRGISISIDDFGTGYSSLYYLKNFPIDVLKIDQSFVRDITTDDSDAQIVETIILMARNLGIGVVAEGVETREQLEVLKGFNCEKVQGFYYSKPLPLEKLVEFLRKSERSCSLGE